MLYGCDIARSSTSKFVLELLTDEICSKEAPMSGIFVEVMSKDIGILTPFGPIQPFL